MLATLQEAKASTLANIAGSCTNSQQFLGWLNEATSRLLRKGDWTGTVVPMYFCVYKGCVVFPRYVGQVRRMSRCRHTPVPVRNMYWDFVPDSVYSWDHYACGAGMGGSWHPWADGHLSLTAQGYTPVAQDIMGDGRLIRAYPRCQLDIGKTLTIFGLDNSGQPLMTQNPDHTWTEGVTITMANPFGSTNTYVRQIDRVLKEVTQCPVDVFAYNASLDVLEDVAHYDPSETNPRFTKYTLSGGPCGAAWTGCQQGVIALVKLKFVPAKVDNDLVLIQNLDALKDMVQSIKLSEQGDLQGTLSYERKAIAELNRELEDEVPPDHVFIRDNVFAGVGFKNQCF